MSAPDGGPAFPLHGFVNDDDTVTPHTSGMSLREYTAVEMMAALVASGGGELQCNMYHIAASYASCATVLADALMKKLKEATE